jgi:hypothetical protein
VSPVTDAWQEYREWTLGEIGAMESQWPDLSMAEAYGHEELRFSQWADDYARDRGHADARAYHEALVKHIRENGIANPIGLGAPYESERFGVSVINGQHRYFAAVDAGLTTAPAGPNRIAPMPLVPGWDYDTDIEAA